MSKKGKVSRQKQSRQKMIEKPKRQQKQQKKGKFFGANKKGNRNLEKLGNKKSEMQQQVQFESEQDEVNMIKKITGRIYYEWFSIKYSRRAPMQKENLLGQFREVIESRLRQVDQIITKNQRNQQRRLFVINIWRINMATIGQYQFGGKERQGRIHGPLEDQGQQLKDMRKILCYMNESRAKELILNCKIRQILLMFSHVQFRNLKQLTLNGQIDSLEPLEWMDCPNLARLNIQDTLVSNSKPLSKLYSSKLHTLLIRDNEFATFEPSRIRMKRGSNLKVVQTIYMRQHRVVLYHNEKIELQDVGKMAKAQAGWYGMHRQERLANNRIKTKLMEKLYVGEGWVGRGVMEYEGDSSSDSDID